MSDELDRRKVTKRILTITALAAGVDATWLVNRLGAQAAGQLQPPKTGLRRKEPITPKLGDFDNARQQLDALQGLLSGNPAHFEDLFGTMPTTQLGCGEHYCDGETCGDGLSCGTHGCSEEGSGGCTGTNVCSGQECDLDCKANSCAGQECSQNHCGDDADLFSAEFLDQWATDPWVVQLKEHFGVSTTQALSSRLDSMMRTNSVDRHRAAFEPQVPR